MLDFKVDPNTSELFKEIPITKALISTLFGDIIRRKFNDINTVVNEEDGEEGRTFAGDIIFKIDTYLENIDEPLDESDLYSIVWEIETLTKRFFDDRNEPNLPAFQELKDEFIGTIRVIWPFEDRPYIYGETFPVINT